MSDSALCEISLDSEEDVTFLPNNLLHIPKNFQDTLSAWVDSQSFDTDQKEFVYQPKSGVTQLQANAGCLLGSSKVPLFIKNEWGFYTMEEVYDSFKNYSSLEHSCIFTLSFDPSTKSLRLNQVHNFLYSGVRDVLTLTLENGLELTGTPDHKIMTTSGWKPLDQLSQSDTVFCTSTQNSLTLSLTSSTVLSIKSHPQPQKTFDISCQSPYNSFLANGVVVHNSGKTHSLVSPLS